MKLLNYLLWPYVILIISLLADFLLLRRGRPRGGFFLGLIVNFIFWSILQPMQSNQMASSSHPYRPEFLQPIPIALSALPYASLAFELHFVYQQYFSAPKSIDWLNWSNWAAIITLFVIGVIVSTLLLTAVSMTIYIYL